MNNKNVYIIAGPNGAGKTTFATKFLPDYVRCPNFVNADLIAHGLSPFSPRIAAMKAGRLVLEQIKDFAAKGIDFAFESTLSGKLYLSFLRNLKKKGYVIHIFFLWIPNAELAIARIKERVADGGDDVPVQDIRRRFYRGIHNFFRFYRQLTDIWILFDNSATKPTVIAQSKDNELTITDNELFDRITKNIKV